MNGKVLAIAALAAPLLTACTGDALGVPVAMSPSTQGGWSSPTFDRNMQRADRTVDRARRDGTLSQEEARPLRQDQRALEHMADRLASDGLTEWEQRELDNQSQVLADTQQAQVLTRPEQ